METHKKWALAAGLIAAFLGGIVFTISLFYINFRVNYNTSDAAAVPIPKEKPRIGGSGGGGGEDDSNYRYCYVDLRQAAPEPRRWEKCY